MTAFTVIRPYLRHALQDPDGEQYPDTVLDAGLRAVVAMGEVEGLTLSTGQDGVDPAITDPNQMGLLVYRSAMSFAAAVADSESVTTRAISWRRSGRSGFLAFLADRVSAMESGSAFDSWSSLEMAAV